MTLFILELFELIKTHILNSRKTGRWSIKRKNNGGSKDSKDYITPPLSDRNESGASTQMR